MLIANTIQQVFKLEILFGCKFCHYSLAPSQKFSLFGSSGNSLNSSLSMNQNLSKTFSDVKYFEASSSFAVFARSVFRVSAILHSVSGVRKH